MSRLLNPKVSGGTPRLMFPALARVGSSCRFGRQWYAIVAYGTFLVFWVTLVCGEANRCSVTIAVWLVTGNAAVSRPIRRQATSRRRGRTRPASRVMKALTVLLAMPRCRRMRRCTARCSVSCSPPWRRAGRRCCRRASISTNTGYRRGCSTRRGLRWTAKCRRCGSPSCCNWIA